MVTRVIFYNLSPLLSMERLVYMKESIKVLLFNFNVNVFHLLNT